MTDSAGMVAALKVPANVGIRGNRVATHVGEAGHDIP
jgi:hypothetical protein